MSKQQIKIRLAEIDTPELAQPYGSKAKVALSDLVFGKEARIVVHEIDRYGRTVGRVYVGNIDVNAELVRQGAQHGFIANICVTSRCYLWKRRPKQPRRVYGHCNLINECRHKET